MWRWNWVSTNWPVVLAILLMPGGFFLLAWALYRRCSPLANARKSS